MNVHAANSNNLSHGITPPSRPSTSELLQTFAEEIAALERAAPHHQQQPKHLSPPDERVVDGFTPRPLAEEGNGGCVVLDKPTNKAAAASTGSAKLAQGEQEDGSFGAANPLFSQQQAKAAALTPQSQAVPTSQQAKMLHPHLFADASSLAGAGAPSSSVIVPNPDGAGGATAGGGDALLHPDELSEFFAASNDAAAARRSSLAPLLSALEQQERQQQQQQMGGSGLAAAAGISSRRSSLAPLLSLMDGGGGFGSVVPQDRRTSLDLLAGLSSSRRPSLGPLFQDSSFLPQQTPQQAQQQEALPAVATADLSTAGGGAGRNKRKIDEFGREYEVGTLNDLGDENDDGGGGDRLRHHHRQQQQRRRSSMSFKASILRRMSGFSSGTSGSVGPLDQFDWAASSVPGTGAAAEDDDNASAAAQVALARRRSSMGMSGAMGMDFLGGGDDDDAAFAQVALARRRSSMGMGGGVGGGGGGMLRRLSSMGTLASAGWLDEALGVPNAEEATTAPRPPGQGDAAAGVGIGIGIDLEEELFRRSSLGFQQSYQCGTMAAASAPSSSGGVNGNDPHFVTPDFGGVVRREEDTKKGGAANIVTPSLEAGGGASSSVSRKKPRRQQQQRQGPRRVSVACSESSTSSAASSVLSSAAATAAASNSSASSSSSSKARHPQQRSVPPGEGGRIDPHRAATKLVVAMERTKKSQQMLHNWDKKMGLKKSHSKTMRMSRTSREKLLDEVGMQLLMAGGGIAAEMAFHRQMEGAGAASAAAAGLVR